MKISIVFNLLFVSALCKPAPEPQDPYKIINAAYMGKDGDEVLNEFLPKLLNGTLSDEKIKG